ncbi:hypothetical protein G3I60_03975 [Streptomyces sp. SID13666]|uniref:hypothetical protein n=1 Tax=Streptomyces sp. SID13588 TaxID=2706051 RepID=UPI0013C13A82|nr:hypothetical protein [Streptomyces sp. SID13588]NEA53342.1 hypothetical protein [Streptomyces sp. SID13666]NEA69331.1 hypothetical protein [Streptomyces sp. SID13588]
MPLIEDRPRPSPMSGGRQMHNRPDRGGTGHRRYRPVGAALGTPRESPPVEARLTATV